MCQTLMALEILYQVVSVNQYFLQQFSWRVLEPSYMVVAETSIHVTLGKQPYTDLICRNVSPFHTD